MILVALSPFTNSSKNDILNFIKTTDADLVLLPGNSTNTPSPIDIQNVLLRDNTNVFVEDHGAKLNVQPYLVSKKSIQKMPRQIFGSNPTAKDIDDLVNTLPNRKFSIAGKNVLFFLCGELIAFNPDGNLKFKRTLPVDYYDILANPAHSLMGHWNYLSKKLAALSEKSVVAYTTNNNKNRVGLTTDVRIYNRGLYLPSRYANSNMSWCIVECKT